jgi:cytochrome c-type biogenesis protein
MNPLLALLMGFTFSFAWTPCVGPALASVLLMASGAKSQLLGIFLVFVYTAGFIIPFLLLGLFTAQVLNFLKSHQGILKYTVKVGGALLILIGIMTFTGWMNGISKYLNTFVPPAKSKELNYENQEESKSASSKEEAVTDQGASTSEDKLADNDTEKKNEDIAGSSSGQDSENEARTDKTLAFDFTLTDQYGKEHTLSDYKGKVVFLNFWATWCPPCRKEMPDIEELYKEYGENKEDVIFLGVANPTSDEYPNNSDVKQEEIVSFLEENGYSFPTVFDVSGDLLSTYYISAFPTTFLIDKEGYIYGYAAGMMTKDVMKSAITQTMESTE